VSLVVHDFRGFSCHFPGKCGKCRRATVIVASALRPWDVFCVLAQNKNRKNMKKENKATRTWPALKAPGPAYITIPNFGQKPV